MILKNESLSKCQEISSRQENRPVYCYFLFAPFKFKMYEDINLSVT